jgi:peptidoglycan-N-acetylglucosamine deacetylase
LKLKEQMENLPVDNEKKELLAKEKRWEKYYLVKTPLLLKKIYPDYLWSVNTKEKILYLTFDDGPHPVITAFVLRELKRYNALATFFCIGKNVVAHPSVYR